MLRKNESTTTTNGKFFVIFRVRVFVIHCDWTKTKCKAMNHSHTRRSILGSSCPAKYPKETDPRDLGEKDEELSPQDNLLLKERTDTDCDSLSS